MVMAQSQSRKPSMRCVAAGRSGEDKIRGNKHFRVLTVFQCHVNLFCTICLYFFFEAAKNETVYINFAYSLDLD